MLKTNTKRRHVPNGGHAHQLVRTVQCDVCGRRGQRIQERSPAQLGGGNLGGLPVGDCWTWNCWPCRNAVFPGGLRHRADPGWDGVDLLDLKIEFWSWPTLPGNGILISEWGIEGTLFCGDLLTFSVWKTLIQNSRDNSYNGTSSMPLCSVYPGPCSHSA